MSPKEFLESGWPQRLGAKIVATNGHTYQSGAHQSEIDFFLVEASLATAGSACWAKQEPSISKHSIVVLEISGDFRGGMVQRIRRPKKLPSDLPVGPVYFPKIWDGFWVQAKAARSPDDVEELFSKYQSKAIPELLSNLQIDSQVSVEDFSKPMETVMVGAAKQCTGYLLKPNFAPTWRHLQE